MPYDTVVAKTIEYLAIPSVVGHEQHFIKFLIEDFEKLGLVVTKHNGLIEVSVAKPNNTIISAHIDRHGLISMGDGHYGYAAEYIKENKYNEDATPSRNMLNAIGERFDGEDVYAYESETGKTIGHGKISTQGPAIINDNCSFNIHGMDNMSVNTPIAYARTAHSDGTYLKGQIDNVVSLGIIYCLFQNGFQGRALLTCEEEIGKSWTFITDWLRANKIVTKNLLILDTSPYREVAPVEGAVIVLRNRDKSAIFNADLTQTIMNRCIETLIPYQFKDDYLTALGTDTSGLGSTELGRIIQNSDGKWSGATIQIPTTEYHTSYETTSRLCIENFYALLHNILIYRNIFNENDE